MFLESAEPLSWDKENAYTRDAIELYYKVGCCIYICSLFVCFLSRDFLLTFWFNVVHQAGSGGCLSKKEIISNFLQGTVASHIESFGDDETDAVKSSANGNTSVGTFIFFLFYFCL